MEPTIQTGGSGPPRRDFGRWPPAPRRSVELPRAARARRERAAQALAQGCAEHPVLRAIRAALQLCALSSQKGIPIQFRIGIAKTDNQRIAEAQLLAQSNKFLSTDILVTKDVFMNVKMMFMAEEFSDIDLPNGPLTLPVYAVKGTISS